MIVTTGPTISDKNADTETAAIALAALATTGSESTYQGWLTIFGSKHWKATTLNRSWAGSSHGQPMGLIWPINCTPTPERKHAWELDFPLQIVISIIITITTTATITAITTIATIAITSCKKGPRSYHAHSRLDG